MGTILGFRNKVVFSLSNDESSLLFFFVLFVVCLFVWFFTIPGVANLKEDQPQMMGS